MFREMRRKEQQLPPEESAAILSRGTSGVLAVLGEDGYPYAVPLSYVYQNGALWFHCAVTGHKLDAVARCDKASFCVIDQDRVIPEKLTTAYRSVVAFGRIRVVEDAQEARQGAQWLGEKYNPGGDEQNAREIESSLSRMRILRLDVEHMTGKEGLELTRARRAGR